jgi:hypothetical protein
MTEKFDDNLDLTARQLATEISPERDLWPGIAEAIEKPQRPRWMPMLAQAAAVVLLIGGSSAVTYVAVKDNSGPITAVAPDLVFEQASFGKNYNLGPGFQDARNSLRAELDVELTRLRQRDAAAEVVGGISRGTDIIAPGRWPDAQCDDEK